MRQVLSDNGSRRMWITQVEAIDTESLLSFNWHKFYNDLRTEFRESYAKGEMPWLLTHEEIKKLNAQNKNVSAKSELAIVLEELYSWYEPFDPKLLKPVAIKMPQHPKLTKQLQSAQGAFRKDNLRYRRDGRP